MAGDTVGAVRWISVLMMFLAMLGLSLIFVGGSYKNLDSSQVTVFEGFSPSVYDGMIKFVTVGGAILAGIMVTAVFLGMKDVFQEAIESLYE